MISVVFTVVITEMKCKFVVVVVIVSHKYSR